jgi:ribosome biogenesis GTPase
MTLESLGYQQDLDDYLKENGLGDFIVGRVTAEHKERYAVSTGDQEYDAEIIGNLRYTAQNRSDFPAVGDWVALSPYDEDKALIHAVIPRSSFIERQAVGKKGEKQLIATNIDKALIVQSVDRDFNINRIERYLTICNSGGVSPVIILSKIDLVDTSTLTELLNQINIRIKDVPVLAISNETNQGISELQSIIHKGQTYCLLGSSGVGKSTLLNSLMGESHMRTGEIGEHSHRGKHVTTHRELIVLENGGIVIDNPGMREVGITDSEGGLESTFDEIAELAQDCKYKDCTHTSETGCAVLEAVENGEIDHSSYDNFLRMAREKEHYESTVAEKRRKDKNFGKIMKDFKKNNYKKY